MKNLNRRIKREMSRYSAKYLFSGSIMKALKNQKNELYAEYNKWIVNLKNSMHQRKYRAVIGEIEKRKSNFKSLGELHWKYQNIEIDAIFKIIKKKMFNHHKYISKEGSHH